MTCPCCKKTDTYLLLIRVNALGEKGIFWCESCLKQNEPELHKNWQEDEAKLMKCIQKLI